MRYTKLTHKSDYILKLEVGDKVHEAILDFCSKEGVEILSKLRYRAGFTPMKPNLSGTQSAG